MKCKNVLEKASEHLDKLDGRVLDILDIHRPADIEYAKHLAKIVSKISPIIGNMIEYVVVQSLNEEDWGGCGKWRRQDPDFPDAIFDGSVKPKPGIEIKTWFPLATEMTARFKDSILHFQQDQTLVAVVAWIPEYLIYGKPKLIGVWVGSAKTLALARDKHYHNPPDYLVFEPGDTSARTKNLQQTNTNGYKFQGDQKLLNKAKKEVLHWGSNALEFNSSGEYQARMRLLLGKYPYRLDTNFAKIDRIDHLGLENFKKKVLSTKLYNKKISEWARIFSDGNFELSEVLKSLI